MPQDTCSRISLFCESLAYGPVFYRPGDAERGIPSWAPQTTSPWPDCSYPASTARALCDFSCGARLGCRGRFAVYRANAHDPGRPAATSRGTRLFAASMFCQLYLNLKILTCHEWNVHEAFLLRHARSLQCCFPKKLLLSMFHIFLRPGAAFILRQGRTMTGQPLRLRIHACWVLRLALIGPYRCRDDVAAGLPAAPARCRREHFQGPRSQDFGQSAVGSKGYLNSICYIVCIMPQHRNWGSLRETLCIFVPSELPYAPLFESLVSEL